MENTLAVHVLNSLDQLIHVVLDALLWQIVRASLDRLIQVLLHELEDKCKSTRGLIVQNLDELNNVRMRVQSLESLDLSQVIHLVYVIEVRFHALDCNILSVS